MPGSPTERQSRIDGLLDYLSEKKRVPVANLVQLAVRSFLVNAKTAREYVDLMLSAGWASLDGFDYLITPAGKKHLLGVDDWPEPEIVKPRPRPKPPSPPSPTEGDGVRDDANKPEEPQA